MSNFWILKPEQMKWDNKEWRSVWFSLRMETEVALIHWTDQQKSQSAKQDSLKNRDKVEEIVVVVVKTFKINVVHQKTKNKLEDFQNKCHLSKDFTNNFLYFIFFKLRAFTIWQHTAEESVCDTQTCVVFVQSLHRRTIDCLQGTLVYLQQIFFSVMLSLVWQPFVCLFVCLFCIFLNVLFF